MNKIIVHIHQYNRSYAHQMDYDYIKQLYFHHLYKQHHPTRNLHIHKHFHERNLILKLVDHKVICIQLQQYFRQINVNIELFRLLRILQKVFQYRYFKQHKLVPLKVPHQCSIIERNRYLDYSQLNRMKNASIIEQQSRFLHTLLYQSKTIDIDIRDQQCNLQILDWHIILNKLYAHYYQ